jgi:hypothetical protein
MYGNYTNNIGGQIRNKYGKPANICKIPKISLKYGKYENNTTTHGNNTKTIRNKYEANTEHMREQYTNIHTHAEKMKNQYVMNM